MQTYSVVIEIGGTPVALRTGDSAFLHVLEDRYSSFINSPGSAPFEFDIELLEDTKASRSRSIDTRNDDQADADDDLNVGIQDGRWILSRGDFRAEWDPRTGKGRIRQDANPYSADAVLRIVHTLILARQGGFLVHAASAIKNGRAFLFAGVSGAGKTTISRLAPPGTVLLTDEISYVKPHAGIFRAFGTPFAGELAKLGENVSAPLATLFFLEKGPKNRIEDINPDEGLRLLLRNILFFGQDPDPVRLVFESAWNFLQKVPVGRLVFVPDQRVWDLII